MAQTKVSGDSGAADACQIAFLLQDVEHLLGVAESILGDASDALCGWVDQSFGVVEEIDNALNSAFNCVCSARRKINKIGLDPLDKE